MTEAKKKELLGWGCIILGGIFVVAGLVLFIMSNRMNLQMKKTEATILAMYDMQLDNGLKHTMLDLSYRVGDRVVMTTYDYPGVLPKEEATIDIYYDIRHISSHVWIVLHNQQSIRLCKIKTSLFGYR